MPEKKEKTISKNDSSTDVMLEAGKFCLDIAKLVFGGVILAGLMKQDIDYVSLFFIGIGVVIVFAFWGFRLIASSKKKK